MRPRTKKHLEERFDKCKYLVVEDPKACKGQWKRTNEDGSQRPLHLEIGCGKGAFVTGMAAANPDVDFVALECVKSVIMLAMEKTDALQLPNIRFIYGDARELNEYFSTDEVDRIYLNFSDPWPKKRHWKNRLSHPGFIKIYNDILPSGGKIFQKTDNRPLFDFSLESFASEGYSLENVTYDLHKSGFEGNVMTEYETRFTQLGQPIYRLEASKP